MNRNPAHRLRRIAKFYQQHEFVWPNGQCPDFYPFQSHSSHSEANANAPLRRQRRSRNQAGWLEPEPDSGHDGGRRLV